MAIKVNDGLKWYFDNKSSDPANAILIYSWDEFTESAVVLCPTRDTATGLPNTARLDSVGNAIKSWEDIWRSLPQLLKNPCFAGTTDWSLVTANSASVCIYSW